MPSGQQISLKLNMNSSPAVFDIKEAIKPDAPKIHEKAFPKGNIVWPVVPFVGEDMMMHLKRGDPDKAFEECDFVDESEADYNSLCSAAAMESPVTIFKYDIHRRFSFTITSMRKPLQIPEQSPTARTSRKSRHRFPKAALTAA